jgi:hypothetical protein
MRDIENIAKYVMLKVFLYKKFTGHLASMRDIENKSINMLCRKICLCEGKTGYLTLLFFISRLSAHVPAYQNWYKQNLKGSDDGVWHSESLDFWTSSIVRNCKDQKMWHFGNWICFHSQVREGRQLLCWAPWFSHWGELFLRDPTE